MISFSRLGSHGRLGNQLFQYALLLGVAAKTGFKIGIPRMRHLLGEFHLPEEVFNASIHPSRRITPSHRERQYGFDESVFSVEDGTDFFGYYQTEKYFEHVGETVRSHLVPASKYVERATADMDGYRSEWDRTLPPGYSTVMLHMRRGDNVHGGGIDPKLHASFIPLQPLAYYRNAIDLLSQCTKQALAYVVFSNDSADAAWCSENFPLPNAVYRGGPEDDPVWDFACMLLCDHKIISNSTMSWWAAWLSEKPSAIIVRPTLWFGPAYPPPRWDIKDLFPERWLSAGPK
jgi:hypothetical protein